MTAINIKAFTKDVNEVKAIKAFMKALKIKFELLDETESPYNKEFVEKIKMGDVARKNGKGRKVTLSELDQLWK